MINFQIKKKSVGTFVHQDLKIATIETGDYFENVILKILLLS